MKIKMPNKLKRAWLTSGIFSLKRYLVVGLGLILISSTFIATMKIVSFLNSKPLEISLLVTASLLVVIGMALYGIQIDKIIKYSFKENYEIKKKIIEDVRKEIWSDLPRKMKNKISSKKIEKSISGKNVNDRRYNILYLIENSHGITLDDLQSNYDKRQEIDEVLNSHDRETIELINKMIVEKFLNPKYIDELDWLIDDDWIENIKEPTAQEKTEDAINTILDNEVFNNVLTKYFEKYQEPLAKLERFDKPEQFQYSKLRLTEE